MVYASGHCATTGALRMAERTGHSAEVSNCQACSAPIHSTIDAPTLANTMMPNLRPRPEYFFRLASVYRRLVRRVPDQSIVDLKFARMRCFGADYIGRNVFWKRIYDLPLCETVWRLLSEGDTFIDVGANQGLVTLLAAQRVGAKGIVLAFEADPVIVEYLNYNILLNGIENTTVRQLAISSKSGIVDFSPAPDDNLGQGRVIAASPQSSPGSACLVECQPLSNFREATVARVIKIDVEGHEMDVLRGMSAILECTTATQIVVFEAHDAVPPCEMLEALGYTVLGIGQGWRRPLLFPWRESQGDASAEPNYLATRNPDFVHSRMSRNGWNVI